MKIFSNYRYLILTAFAFVVINVNAQTGGEIKITSSFKLEKGNNGYDVINNTNEMSYGLFGAIIKEIEDNIQVVEPEHPDTQQIVSTNIYRIYFDGNSTETSEIKINLQNDNDFQPRVGMNQYVKYKVVFNIEVTNTKTGDKNTITYPDENGFESDEFKFSIYDSDGYIFNIKDQPKGAAKNTYAGRTDHISPYSINFNENGKTLPSHRIDWTINDNLEVVHNGDSYEFDPSGLTNKEKVDYTFTATPIFLRPGTTDEVWFKGENVTTDALSVYPEQPDVDASKVLHGPANVKGNTTHNDVECTYTVDITNNDYGIFGKLKYTWSNNSQLQANFTSNDYIYTPSVSNKETHTIHVKVACVNPDDDKEEWYTFVDNDFEKLTIYRNPNFIKQNIIDEYVKYPKVEGSDKFNTYNTYIGKEDALDYKVEIPDSSEYGRWYVVWTRDENNEIENSTSNYTIPGMDAPFVPSKRCTCTTKISLRCYNPEDTNDIWLDINDTEIPIPTLGVYYNPNEFEIQDEYYIFPTGKELAEHKGNNCSREYGVNLPDDAIHYGKWVYKWTRNGSVVSETSNANISIPVSVDTYVTSLELRCVNPDTNEEWREVDVPPALSYPYVVYATPTCNTRDCHEDENPDSRDYAMFVGQTFDAESLLKIEGGNNDGWTKEFYIIPPSGEKPELPSDYSFKPTQDGEYTLLFKKITNIALLSDNSGIDTLFSPVDTSFTFRVYPEPKDSVTIKIGDNDEEKYKDTEKETLDITKGETIIISASIEGGYSEGWSIDNTTNVDDFSEIKNEGLRLELEGNYYDDLNNDWQGHTSNILFSVTNTPPNIIKGLEHKNIYTQKTTQWRQLTCDFKDSQISESTEKRDETTYYIIATCEGLNNSKEEIRLRPIGGVYYNWTADWIPANDSDPSLKALKGERKAADEYYLEWDTVIIASFENEKSFKANYDGTPKTYHYTVNTYYKKNKKAKKTFHVDIITYPKPELSSVSAKLKDKSINNNPIDYELNEKNEIKADCYNGDEIQLKFDLSGGISDDDDVSGWKYLLNGNEEQMSEDCTRIFTSEYSGKLKMFYNYPGKYYTSKKEWYNSDDYNLDFKFYPIPELNPELTDSINGKWGEDIVDVYAGNYPQRNNVNLKFKPTNEGYPDGWTYTCTLDDGNKTVPIQTFTTSNPTITYEPSITTEGKKYEVKTITVLVSNQIGENKAFEDKVYNYPIRVWKKAEFPENFTLKDRNQEREISNGVFPIREGNHLIGSVPDIKFGYNDNNEYIWSDSYVQTGQNVPWDNIISGKFSDVSKKGISEEKVYNLTIENKGPSGNVWDKRSYSHKVVVYNKPETPTSIVQKGNGTSRTMIATADISDQDLQGREYYLVFGYSDENGDHDFASQRQIAPGQVRWSTQINQQQMSNAYVYAVWKYDTAEITSGKCTLTGIDEEYDSSTYNGTTRAAIGGDNPNAIEIASGNREVRSVYNLNGVRVGSSLSGLKAGLYIVEFADGVVNKINVK